MTTSAQETTQPCISLTFLFVSSIPWLTRTTLVPQIFVTVAKDKLLVQIWLHQLHIVNTSRARKQNLTEDPSAGVFNNHRPVSGLQGVEGAPAWMLYGVINYSLDIVHMKLSIPAWILYGVINSRLNKIKYSQRMIKFNCRCFQFYFKYHLRTHR